MTMVIIKTLIFKLLIGLFIYSKMLPYSSILNPGAKNLFSFLNKLFMPVCSFVSKSIPLKWEIGNNGIKFDFSQIIVFAILLIINNFI